jgi:acyl carrier protein
MALVAYVVAKPGGAPGAALRAFVAERLPAAMVPSAFVPMDRLPLTPNGKLDLGALPSPEGMDGPGEEDDAAPGSPVEQAVAGIWAEVLQLERVKLHDDFFELGGHSLLATRVVARMRTALGIELPLRSLFEAPTVASLALVITEYLLAEFGDSRLAASLDLPTGEHR